MKRRTSRNCGAHVPVTVTSCRDGRYEMHVAGQPGCFWEWTVLEDGEIIAEGDDRTMEGAMKAAEHMVNSAKAIAAGAWDLHTPTWPSH